MQRLRKALVLLALLYALPAAAEVQINGFGQVVGGAVTRGDGLVDLPYAQELSFAPESLFALQLTAPLTDRWDAIGQLVARGREDYEPEFTWAYLRYQINPHWSLKAGRQRIRFHRYSDYLEVGAAYPFLRPPRSIYAVGLTDFEGLNLTGSYGYGDWTLTANISSGTGRTVTEQDGRDDSELVARSPLGLVTDATYRDWLSLRASYFRARGSVRNAELTQLFAALRASGEADVARELDFEEERGAQTGLGVNFQLGTWTLGGEYSRFDFDDTFIGSRTGYSALLAYRWRNWTPVVVYGRAYGGAGPDAVNATDPAHPLFPAVVALTTASRVDDRYLSVGARCDLSETLAIKLDYTHREARGGDRGSSGVLASGLVFTF